MVEIDDDLQGLLEELDIGPDETEKPVAPPTPIVPIAPVIPQSNSLEPAEAPKVLPLVPILEDPEPPVEVDKEADTDLFDGNTEKSTGALVDVKEFISRHDKDYEEAKNSLRADRAKADELVRLLMERVETGSASNQETESLVQAVKCLVDSNGHMVRLLDSKSKLLSASKGSVGALIQQNFGNNASDSDLEDILTQQIDEV